MARYRLLRHIRFKHGVSVNPCKLFGWILAFASVPSLAAHNSLLPLPQHVDYKPGDLQIASLSIKLASAHPSKPDLFAAAELQRKLLERTGVRLPISQARGNQHLITLDRTGALQELPEPHEDPGPNSRESYQIQVGPSGAIIRSRSSAGVFYGVQTLAQMVEGRGERAVLPEASIQDWPALAYRGIMVDMSEGQLATEKEVERQIDHLALWKGNQYYLYSEDSIELKGYPLLNPDARFSKDQIRRIIAYANERHVDVVPCLEFYGHQHDLFRIEKYSDLADFPHGGEFDPTNGKVRELLDDWVDQYAAIFPSRFVHIGFDETWEISRAAKKAGPNTTPARLFVAQMDTVARRFQKHGKTVLAWADIMVKYPGIMEHLPQGIVAVPWYYEPDPDPQYRQWLDPLIAHNVPNFVAPGVTMFNQIAPNFAKSFRNIDTFLSAGKKARTTGLINTFWTDDQMELRRSGWPGMAYGAAAGWEGADVDRSNFFLQCAETLYTAEAAAEVAQGLQQLSAAELSLEKTLGSDTMIKLWRNPFQPTLWENLELHKDDLHQTRLLAEEAQQHFASAVSQGANPQDLNSLVFDSRMLDYAGMKALYAVEIGELWEQQIAKDGHDEDLWDRIDLAFSTTHGKINDLTDSLSWLQPAYKENWLAEYTPYRLATAMAKFDMEYQTWLHFKRRYGQFRESYKQGASLPKLSDLAGDN